MKSKLLILAMSFMAITFSQSVTAQSEGLIGEIKMFAGNFAPRGWALCDGQLLPIASNTALFSILGTTYGGDGRTTFAMPDMKGRVAIHPGTGPRLSTYKLGQKGGEETTVIQTENLPAHTHHVPTVNINETHMDDGMDAPGEGTSVSVGVESTHSLQVHSDGSATPMNNVQPYQCVNYIICITGIYPSRN